MSEMKATERYEASLTEEGRLRLLLDAVVDYAIYMLDADGIVSSWNSGARRFKGYDEAEILGKHFSCFYTVEDRLSGMPARALETAAREGKFEGEGWRLRKDGTRFWAHVVIDPVHDSRQRLIGYAKITRDLTERRRIVEELRRSNEQFKLLVQSVTEYAIYMLDPQGRIASWNAGAERLKGYGAAEIIGQNFARFYTDEEREQGIPANNLRIAAESGRFEKEGWRVRKDGSRFWANVVIDPIRAEDGKLIGFAKITRDFTERREAQRALDEAREALFQSQKLDAIGKLTGGVAHDFNNLLMAIVASLEIARKRLPGDPKVTPFLDNAMQAAQRGATLTQRMLMFARRQKLNPEITAVPALVHGMNGLLQRSIGPAHRIELRFPISLPPVLVDPNQLETAILNLALNARDAMPEGGLILILAEEAEMNGTDGRQPAVKIAVIDHGEGMDDATLGRAIEPFFTTKGVGKGTGLGLSMVQGLADQSNGRLVLRSKKGQGTTVEIWLPVATSESPQKASPEAEPPPPATRALTVLAVDDDPLVLVNTKAMLEDMGHRAFTVGSGADALKLLKQGVQVDLVLTDQAMPHMTGVQLAQFIAAEWPDLPVIIATGYAEMPTDPDGHIPRLNKPYLQADLARTMAAALREGA
jgi:PAS domain S-box-containing protein